MPTTDHDCAGCRARAKTERALERCTRGTSLEDFINAVLGDLTLAELSMLAGTTVAEWVEEDPRSRRLFRKLRGVPAPASGDRAE
jgi:hypothetical protein